jgi:hypothetical protein
MKEDKLKSNVGLFIWKLYYNIFYYIYFSLLIQKRMWTAEEQDYRTWEWKRNARHIFILYFVIYLFISTYRR